MEPPTTRVSAARSRRRKPWPARLLRGLIFAVPAVLVCLLVAFLAGKWWLDGFVRSDEFRHFLDRKASAALQADARIEPLHWDHGELYTAGIDVHGHPDGPLAAFNADQVRATLNLGALWRRIWRIDALDVERITAELAAAPARKIDPSAPRPDQVPGPGSDGGFLASLLPNRVEIGEVHVSDFSLKWNSGKPGGSGQLANTRLAARMLGDVKNWEINGRGGRLAQDNLPPASLDDFALKTTEDAIFITRATGRFDSGGTLELSGKEMLTGAKTVDLVLNLDGAPVEPFLPPDWRTRLHGRATGTVKITGTATDETNWQSNGHLELREGRLEALPVLDQLAVFASSARYRQSIVQNGSVDFTWSPNELRARNLVLESEGLLRVEGEFTVRDKQIDGTFRVGLATSTTRWLDQLGANVFNLPTHDGYAWTTMRLTGPVDNPHDDLTGRLASSAADAVAKKAKQGTDAVLDTASGLLDLLKPH